MLALWLGSGALPAIAQQRPQPTDAPPSRAMIPFVEPAFGFQLEIPADWRYDRTRFQQFEDSVGVLRGTSPAGREALRLIIFRDFKKNAIPFEDWVIGFGKQLAADARADHVDWEAPRVAGRAGALLRYTTKIGGDPTVNFCLCVPFDERTVLVLVYSGATLRPEDAAALGATYDQMQASLQVTYDAKEVEALEPALTRGRKLVAMLRTRAGQIRIEPREQTYEMFIGNEPIGYMQRGIRRDRHTFTSTGARRQFSKEGLHVVDRSWRFANDGTVRFSYLDAFSADDRHSEVIRYQQVQFPAPDVQPQKMIVKTQDVIREDDALFSSYATNFDHVLPDPAQPIRVGPAYLDLAWSDLLPGLVLGTSTEPHAFAVYSTSSRAMLALAIEPEGEAPLPGGQGMAQRFTLRFGFIDTPSTLYTDRQGYMLRLEAGDVVIQQADPQAMEQKYGARRDAARARFQDQVGQLQTYGGR